MAVINEVLHGVVQTALDVRDTVAKQDQTLRRLSRAMDSVAASHAQADAADRRAKVFKDAEQRLETQSKYDEVFQRYGEKCPPPVADVDPADYRFSSMKMARDRLSRANDRKIDPKYNTTVGEIAGTPLGGMHDDVLFGVWEPNVLKAAQTQAERPHTSTLPPAGQFVSRVAVDDTGRRKVEYFGRESFVKGFSTPGRRVKIQDPREALAYARATGLYK